MSNEPREPLDLSCVMRTCMKHGYCLDKKLGKGGNATVFLVKSLKYDCDFCVKVCQNIGKSPERDREIQALMKMNHPNILRVYDCFEDNSYFYMILEYCPGGSLYEVVAHEGPLPYERLVPIFSQLAAAVKACHDEHLAHRDIKPGNVLLDPYGRPKLADFGLSVAGETTIRSHAGSIAFMAPEIWQRKDGHNPFKADIWALGVTFFYLATGQLPWDTTSMQELIKSSALGYVSYDMENLPQQMVDLLRHMININVAQRFSIDQVIASSMLTEPYGASPPRVEMHKTRSLTLAGLKFVAFSPAGPYGKHSATVPLQNRVRSQKSSGCLLSFAPAFGEDPQCDGRTCTKHAITRRSTFDH